MQTNAKAVIKTYIHCRPELTWHPDIQRLQAEQRTTQYYHRKNSATFVLFMFNFMMTITHFAEMKQNMIAMKPTTDRYNVRLLLMS